MLSIKSMRHPVNTPGAKFYLTCGVDVNFNYGVRVYLSHQFSTSKIYKSFERLYRLVFKSVRVFAALYVFRTGFACFFSY